MAPICKSLNPKLAGYSICLGFSVSLYNDFCSTICGVGVVFAELAGTDFALLCFASSSSTVHRWSPQTG
jgi:hypothetical protein